MSLIQSVRVKQGCAMPQWISTAMACIFALHWTFTMLPHTVGIRSISFAVGAILGAYIIAKNYRLLFQKNAAPIWLIFLLFVWMTIHLLFIGKNYELQIAEYLSLWKRAALGCIFAIGFGVAVAQNNKSRDWWIVVLGLCSPPIIYFVKYIATHLLPVIGFKAPFFLMLFNGAAEFYVAKISYVFFCLPLLAIAIGMLSVNIKRVSVDRASYVGEQWFWILVVMFVFGVFMCENIKNGIIYSAVLIVVFMISVLKNGLHRLSRSNLKIIAVILLAGIIFVFHNIRSNSSWGTLLADYEIASQVSPDVVWKTQDSYYPKNKYGVTVSVTNFDRIFYAATGLNLLENNLMGYGLVQSSFGHLAREQWPKAPLIQSHSGWLDLALGLGAPGVLLLLISSLLAIRNIASQSLPWSIFGACGLGSILLLYSTTEVAQKNYVDTFVWLIVLVASLSLQPPKHFSKLAH